MTISPTSAADSGTYSISLTIKETMFQTSLSSGFKVTVTNNAPTKISDIPNFTVENGKSELISLS